MQNCKFGEVKKHSCLGEVHEGGGSHWTLVPSKKKKKRKKKKGEGVF
jgi:hypothetical protein